MCMKGLLGRELQNYREICCLQTEMTVRKGLAVGAACKTLIV